MLFRYGYVGEVLLEFPDKTLLVDLFFIVTCDIRSSNCDYFTGLETKLPMQWVNAIRVAGMKLVTAFF